MTFTPDTTVAFEKTVRMAAIAQIAKMNTAFDEVWDSSPGDYELTVVIYRQAMRGDMDNFVKAVSDALNEVAYEDDKYIMAGHSRMHLDRDNPRVEVLVRRWDLGQFSIADYRAGSQ
jgi:Holliday junction resolvase RusA-like endonuclease